MIQFIHKVKINLKIALQLSIYFIIFIFILPVIQYIYLRQSMSTNQRKEQLKKFLQKFDETPITLSQLNRPIGQMPMQQFVITYFGMCFLEGYRIIEKIQQNIFVMSLMEYQKGGNLSYLGCEGKRRQLEGHEKHGIFRIVCVEFNQKLNEDREHRQQVYRDIKQIVDFFCFSGHPQNDQNQNSKLNVGSNNKDIQRNKIRQNCSGIQVNFLFAFNFLYSSIKYEQLVKNEKLIIEKFYNRYYGFGKRSDKNEQKQNFGLKILDQREQGTKLHELVELMIKGSGLVRNNQYLNKQVLHQAKFSYKLTKIINSICLIIGREMIEGGYVTISSEKWMRKFSAKRFKKFDLLLRNSSRVCVIDWKFSRVNADEKIATQIFKQKNLQYFKLAKQEYNAEVELKFYCFHQSSTEHHHKFTTADYQYSKQQISLQEKQYRINENNQIQISSSDSENDMNAHRIQDRIRSSTGNNGNNGNSRNLQRNNIFGRLEDKQKYNEYSSITFDKKSQNFVFTQQQQLQPKSSKQKQTIPKGEKTSKSNNRKTELQQILNDLEQDQAQIIGNAGNDNASDDCVCVSGNSMINQAKKQKERQNQKQRERIRRIQKQIQKQFLKQMQSSKSKDKKNKKSRSKSKSNPKSKSKSKSNPKVNKPNQNSKGNPKQKVFQITCISDEDEVISISYDSEEQKHDKNKPFQPDAENNQNENIQHNEGSKQIHFMHINSNKNDHDQNKQSAPSEFHQRVLKSQINSQKNNLRSQKISQSQLYQQIINVAEIQSQNIQNSAMEIQIQEISQMPKIPPSKAEQTKNQERKGQELTKNIMSAATNKLINNIKEKKNMPKAKKIQHYIVID